ncbi:ELMO domain-containing protein A [Glycine max]|nr:ELMO domain-containing protein A [Glycine max]
MNKASLVGGIMIETKQVDSIMIKAKTTLSSAEFVTGSIAWLGRESDDRPSFDLTPAQEECLQRLQNRIDIPCDGSIPEHQDALRALWSAAFPKEELHGLISEQWKDMGWKGKDPSIDFRYAHSPFYMFFLRLLYAQQVNLVFLYQSSDKLLSVHLANLFISLSFFSPELAVLFTFQPAPSPLMAISFDIGPASSAMSFPLSLSITRRSGIGQCVVLLPSLPVGCLFPGRPLGTFSTWRTSLPAMDLAARSLGDEPLDLVNGVSKSLSSDTISSDDPEELRRCQTCVPSALEVLPDTFFAFLLDPNSPRKPFQDLLRKHEGDLSVWEYSFVVVGVNITFMLIQMLDLEAENDSAFDFLYCNIQDDGSKYIGSIQSILKPNPNLRGMPRK